MTEGQTTCPSAIDGRRHDAILASVERYYTAKLREHGSSPRGVDWNSAESQELRFEQLLTLIPGQTPCSLLDYGCGYGALAEYLERRARLVEYVGFDLSAEMLRHGRRRHAGRARVRFVEPDQPLGPADYCVASGIFNVRLGVPDADWLAYLLDTLDRLDQLGTRGFAFNLLTSYADPDKMRPDLYYADPLFLFDHCKRRYSRSVALLHDYPLYEFTIVVRK